LATRGVYAYGNTSGQDIYALLSTQVPPVDGSGPAHGRQFRGDLLPFAPVRPRAGRGGGGPLGLLGRAFALFRSDEAVSHVADGADQRLVLGAQLGAQPPDVDVDRAGAAEVVVAPDLLEELGAREDPARVLGEVLQELELLEGEVEDPPLELGRVGRLVDGEVAVADLHRGVVAGELEAADGEPEAGLHLGGAGGVEEDVVDAPVGGHGGQAALGDDQDQRAAGPGGAQELAEAADLREVAAAVDEDHVGAGHVHQRRPLGGRDAHVVEQQAEGGQHLGRRLEGVGEEQQ
jgi:hypothetical protein